MAIENSVIIDDLAENVSAGLSDFQRAAINAIDACDLDDVGKYVQTQEGWADDTLREAIHEYKKFLAIIALNPDKNFGISEEIDRIWHGHLMFTRSYFELCRKIVGGIIHHEPFPIDEANTSRMEDVRDLTITTLKDTFRNQLSALWSTDSEINSFAKCCSGHVECI